MRYLAVIPARGGSKGIPRKNIRPLLGKPLIGYTLEAAREVFRDGEICLSTDDPEIRDYAESRGLDVPFLRPDRLATDSAGSREVLLHALDHYRERGEEPECLVMLQPTSPLRQARHIREAMDCWDPELDMVVSVKETDANPYYVLYEENEKGYLEPSKEGRFERRQDCPPVWQWNGAIYVINPQSLREGHHHRFRKIKKYVMDRISSVDIDSMADWHVAETFLRMRGAEEQKKK
ncbi:MAG: acylneuraminate cytidylyltransferase family protein [Balneolaceae bacterium]|nr:acylneuraminate cytidylyltransferase family protein [Balneolaceae bacterium]